MSEIKWSFIKSNRLKKVRGVSFEEIVEAKLVSIKKHPNKEHQSIMLFEYKGYIWVVPFVEEGENIFLKTLYPSRKYTKKFRRGEFHEKD